MADTQRSVSEILALLANNSAGAISAQDLRDAFVTWRQGHGELFIAAADSALITLADTSTYVECTAPVWTPGAAGVLHNFDESAGNGRLTYTGAANIVVHVAATVSFSSVSNNRVIHLRIAKNGVTDAGAEVIRKTGTAGDVGSTAIHAIETMSQGDYLSLFALNVTSADDITIEAANLQAMSMPT